MTKEEIQKIKEVIVNFKWPKLDSQKSISFPKCQIIKNRIQHIQDRSITSGVYLVFAFPFLNSNKLSFIQRKAARILLEDIRNHSLKYSLNANLGKIGIYKSDLQIYFYQNLGYFYYMIFGSREQELPIIEVFKDTIEKWKNKDVLLPIISESIQDICSKRNTDNDNETRFYNFSDALARGEIPLNDKQFRKALSNLNSVFWEKLVTSLFNWKKNVCFCY